MTSPMPMPDPRWLEWLAVLGKVVVAARLVTAFDGTDRESLDQLRDALFEFGLIDEQLSEGNSNG